MKIVRRNLRKRPKLSFALLGANVEHVVSPDKRITVPPLELSIDIFFGLFEDNVHITVQAPEDSTVVATIVQLDHNRAACNLL